MDAKETSWGRWRIFLPGGGNGAAGMGWLGARLLECWKLLGRNPPAVITVLVVLLQGPSYCLRDQSDWDVVYVPAAARLLAGDDVFQQGFCYPPVFACLALPWIWCGGLPGRLLALAIQGWVLYVVLGLAWRLSGGRRAIPETGRGREAAFFCLGLVLALGYACAALANQQTDLVVAAIMLTGCCWLTQGRSLAAGAAFGVAAGLKCTPLLWGPYLLWRGQFRAGLLVFAVAIGINLAPDLLVPPQDGTPRLATWVYRHLVFMTVKDYDPGLWHSAIEYNHAAAGVCNRWLTQDWSLRDGHIVAAPSPTRISTGALRMVVLSLDLVLVGLALLAAGWSRRRGPVHLHRGESLHFCLVVLLMVLLTPHSSKPHFCILLLPAWTLTRLAWERTDKVLGGVMGAALVLALIQNKVMFGEAFHAWITWYSCLFWQTLLLFSGCLWALLRPPHLLGAHLFKKETDHG